MTAKDRRAALKADMDKRMEENYGRKDDSGRFKSIFLESVKKDDKFKCDENDHSLDIIPYIAGANNPHVKEGKSAYILDLWVHRKVGVTEDDYICLQRTFKQACPICEYQNELRNQRKNSNDPESFDDEIKALNPTRRAIYNVRSLDKKDDPDVVKIWDVSHYLFEKELLENAKKKRGGGYVPFADIDEGKTVSFRATGKDIARKYTAFEFEDREPIEDAILDKTFCLDELIYIPSYEEVKMAFVGAGSDEDEPVRDRKQKEEPKEESRRKEPEPPKEETRRETRRKEPEDVPEAVGCPYNHEFGSDNNARKECAECDDETFNACEEAFRKIRSARRQPREEVKKEEPKKEESASTSRRRRA